MMLDTMVMDFVFCVWETWSENKAGFFVPNAGHKNWPEKFCE
jgi:hypothetical protein